MDDLTKARNNVSKAQQKMKSGGCGCFSDNQEKKSEHAIKLYEEAAYIFQREKQWHEAGKCFEEIAFLKERLGDSADKYYEEAASSYSFVDKKKSVEVMKNSVKKYEKSGQFSNAGQSYQKMAQWFEEEKEFETSSMFYKRAADSYQIAKEPSKERECNIKHADISTINGLGDWKSYVETYETIGKQYLLQPMLKYQAKDMFFKIVCLYLLYDVRFPFIL